MLTVQNVSLRYGKRILFDEVNIKLNDLSSKYGIAKSAMCAFVIGQWIDQKEKVEGALIGNDAIKKYIDSAIKSE